MSQTTELLLDGAVPPAENPILVGHDAAEGWLATAYHSGKVHHAILIEGPQGIGKATLAFRFAHHVLAHPEPADAPTELADPDRTSPTFRQIAAGACHDLLHLSRSADERSGRLRAAITVEEVRRAGRFLARTSGSGNWRIVIVDCADDLNRSAANAILKILEEPPRRTLFLVISHAPGSLLPTIRSRCLRLRLAPLADDDLKRALAGLGLNAEVERADFAAIAARAEGSVARALVLMRHGGLEIAEAVDGIVEAAAGGAVPHAQIVRLAEAVSARDRETAYDFFVVHICDRIRHLARQAAFAGELRAADRWAQLATSLDETLAVAAAYNLDRKQTVMSALSDGLAAKAG